MKKYIIYLSAILASITAQAQDETDVLRLSQTTPIGTARANALGGAMGSVGADFTALSVNPAALARYSKNEFAFTTSYKYLKSVGTYNTNTLTDTKGKLSIDNVGFVVTTSNHRLENNNRWKTKNFAIGINRLANYNTNYIVNGINYKNSIANFYAQNANSVGGLNNLNNANLTTTMAYGTYLIDTLAGNKDSLFSYVPIGVNGIGQTKTVQQKGGTNEFIIAYAGNYKNKLLLGGTIGLPIVQFSRVTNYEEKDRDPSTTNLFKQLNYTETINSSGMGINLKLGAIFTPNKFLRLGAAIHTPTVYNITDNYTNALSSDLESGGTYNIDGPNYNGISEYTVITPYKAILSGTILAGKYGFVTADYEYIDYTSASIKFTNAENNAAAIAYAQSVNNVIDNTYKGASNLRLGAEARIGDVHLRGGVANYGSPFTNATRAKNRTDVSLGIGIRGKSLFTDIAWVRTITQQNDYMYVLNGSNVPAYTLNNTGNNISLTMGWKF